MVTSSENALLLRKKESVNKKRKFKALDCRATLRVENEAERLTLARRGARVCGEVSFPAAALGTIQLCLGVP